MKTGMKATGFKELEEFLAGMEERTNKVKKAVESSGGDAAVAAESLDLDIGGMRSESPPMLDEEDSGVAEDMTKDEATFDKVGGAIKDFEALAPELGKFIVEGK
jgi:hypothetical protein